MADEHKKEDSGREVRTLTTHPFEFRKASDGSIKVEGYAAVFDEVVEIGRWFREVIRPGAFTSVLSNKDDATFLINHDDLPLARVGSGTLKLSQDSRGLAMEAKLDPNDPDVARIVPKMERKDLSKMSFAFSIYPDGETRWTEQGDEDTELREIIKVGTLFDVSIVTDPAYQGTEIALRSLQDFRKARGDGEPDANAVANSIAQRRMRLRLAGGR